MKADISQPAGFLRPSLEHEAGQLNPFCIYPRYVGSLVSALPFC